MRVFKILVGCLIVLALGAVGLLGTDKLLAALAPSSQGQDRGAQATRVGVTSPRMQRVEDTVSAVGTIRPIRSVMLVPNASGRVTAVNVTSGEMVDAGDLLVQLDDRAERAAVTEAEATLSEAQQNLDRIDELQERNVSAEARLEQARAAFLRAEAALTTARAAVEDRAITAPFGGTLGLIDIEQGAMLDSSVPVTTLSDLSIVEVSAALPERYFGSITADQAMIITTPAYPDREFQGQVTVRALQVDLGSRSFEIRARFDNADGQLAGGMFANARIVLDTYDGLAIPDDAIISEGLTTYVYTVADGKAARTEIDVGASLGALTEVRDGLEMEDRVVVAGWDQLSDGATVEIDQDYAREGLE
ncbi:efflux RND transporter periplasmic adaptor subunit [Maribius pontilimi]|uniref:Efflux RND transporter periplasmic adaptor subunit n=1 Tax=Palleronia pontilimi TaxID=1964209 RepID=A0A934IER9_9RHOB|nr:efflux RND transporter periplasmic adaptor subunit [Palleronia pontilimi]MBJ3762115.1 efflux RND transporter periplasmic adaptor subunit [Palleronia pontilimi]